MLTRLLIHGAGTALVVGLMLVLMDEMLSMVWGAFTAFESTPPDFAGWGWRISVWAPVLGVLGLVSAVLGVLFSSANQEE